MLGPLVIIQNLGHGRGNTSCHTPTGAPISLPAACSGCCSYRTEVVIGSFLPPVASYHRRYRRLVSRGVGRCRGAFTSALHDGINRLLRRLQIPLKRGVVFLRERGLRIAQHFGHQVVVADNGKASAIIAIDSEGLVGCQHLEIASARFRLQSGMHAVPEHTLSGLLHQGFVARCGCHIHAQTSQ